MRCSGRTVIGHVRRRSARTPSGKARRHRRQPSSALLRNTSPCSASTSAETAGASATRREQLHLTLIPGNEDLATARVDRGQHGGGQVPAARSRPRPRALLAHGASARRAGCETPTSSAPLDWARPCAVATPTRRPVNVPGPTPTAIRSTSPSRARLREQLGGQRQQPRGVARTLARARIVASFQHAPSARRRPTTVAGVAVSIASTIIRRASSRRARTRASLSRSGAIDSSPLHGSVAHQRPRARSSPQTRLAELGRLSAATPRTRSGRGRGSRRAGPAPLAASPRQAVEIQVRDGCALARGSGARSRTSGW